MPRKKRKIQAGIPAGYRDGRGKGPIGMLIGIKKRINPNRLERYRTINRLERYRAIRRRRRLLRPPIRRPGRVRVPKLPELPRRRPMLPIPRPLKRRPRLPLPIPRLRPLRRRPGEEMPFLRLEREARRRAKRLRRRI